jgi:2'-5' RNA ligase
VTQVEQANRGEKNTVFFALCPNERCADRLHRIATRLATQLGGRSMHKETLHLTLVFIGKVSEDSLPDLLAIADEATGAFRKQDAGRKEGGPPILLPLDHLGYWPHNRILWIGSDHCPPWLTELADLLAEKLRERGYPIPLRPFAPHVTLVRNVKPVTEASGFDGLQDALAAGRMPIFRPCHHFFLLRSRHAEAGQVYEKLGYWTLKKNDQGQKWPIPSHVQASNLSTAGWHR